MPRILGETYSAERLYKAFKRAAARLRSRVFLETGKAIDPAVFLDEDPDHLNLFAIRGALVTGSADLFSVEEGDEGTWFNPRHDRKHATNPGYKALGGDSGYEKGAYNDTMAVIFFQNSTKKAKFFKINTERTLGGERRILIANRQFDYIVGSHTSFTKKIGRYPALQPKNLKPETSYHWNGGKPYFDDHGACNIHMGSSQGCQTFSPPIYNEYTEFMKHFGFKNLDASATQNWIDADHYDIYMYKSNEMPEFFHKWYYYSKEKKGMVLGDNTVHYTIIDRYYFVVMLYGMLLPIYKIKESSNDNLASAYGKSKNCQGNYYPITTYGWWHDGVHLDIRGNASSDDRRICAVYDGKVVAARLTRPRGSGLSSNFIILKHELERPGKSPVVFYSLYMHLEPLDFIESLASDRNNAIAKYINWIKYSYYSDDDNRTRTISDGNSIFFDTKCLNVPVFVSAGEVIGLADNGIVSIDVSTGKVNKGASDPFIHFEIFSPANAGGTVYDLLGYTGYSDLIISDNDDDILAEPVVYTRTNSDKERELEDFTQSYIQEAMADYQDQQMKLVYADLKVPVREGKVVFKGEEISKIVEDNKDYLTSAICHRGSQWVALEKNVTFGTSAQSLWAGEFALIQESIKEFKIFEGLDGKGADGIGSFLRSKEIYYYHPIRFIEIISRKIIDERMFSPDLTGETVYGAKPAASHSPQAFPQSQGQSQGQSQAQALAGFNVGYPRTTGEGSLAEITRPLPDLHSTATIDLSKIEGSSSSTSTGIAAGSTGTTATGSEAVASNRYKVIKKSGMYIRSSPRIESNNIIGVAQYGQEFTVTSIDGEWSNVGVNQWIWSAYLQKIQ